MTQHAQTPDGPSTPDHDPGLGEGGARRERRARRRRHEWPTVAVLSVLAVGLVLVATAGFRIGGVVLGAAALTGALLRATLSAADAGLLVVRSRWLDVVVLLGLGLGLVVLAVAVPPAR